MYTAEIAATDSAVRRPPAAASLTGLRWFAALSVFLTHSLSVPGVFAPGPVTRVVAFVMAPGSGIGVSFFFVLSGFVLVLSSRSTDTPPVFWRRRIFRIYPNHLVVCAIAVILMLTTGNLVDMHDVPQTLLLVQVWTPHFLSSIGVNGVTWTLGCEVFFYLCFPLLLWLVRRITPSRLLWWAGGVVAVICLVPLIAQLLPAYPVVPIGAPLSDAQSWFVNRFPVVRMLEFTLGIMLARTVLTGRWPRVPVWLACLVMALGWVASALVQDSLWSLVAVTVVPIGLLVATVASADLGGRTFFLGRPSMVWLGKSSYAFYLVHLLVLEYLVFAFSGSITHWRPLSGLSGVAILVVVLAAALLAAGLLHQLVEVPIYRRFATSARHRTGADDVEVASVTAG